MANFLTPTIAERVRRELAASAATGALISKPRIFEDLLSSQPLAFNLFAELGEDLSLATAVVTDLWPELDAAVSAVDFEWSPGRRDARYLGNRSAFDVFLALAMSDGTQGFIGVEVKYHEAMKEKAGEHRKRYERVAARSGVFRDVQDPALHTAPLQQIWLDHLLALSMLQADPDRWSFGRFVFLHPMQNDRCATAAAAYEQVLADDQTYSSLTLEQLTAAIARHTDAPWIGELTDRYLGFAKLDSILET